MAGFSSHYSLLPPVVKALLIANGLMFVLELSYGESLIASLALWPLNEPGSLPGESIAAHFQLQQLVTYSFLHATV